MDESLPPAPPALAPATHARARPALGTGTAVGALLIVLGGAAVALGSLLSWARVSVDYSVFGREGVREITRTGLDTGYGGPAIAAGVVLVVCGVLLLVLRGAGLRRVLGVVALVGGLGAAGLALYESVQAKARIVDDNAVGRSPEFRSRLEDAVTVGPEIGRWVVLAGGVVGAIGGVIALIAAGRTREPAPAEPFVATNEFFDRDRGAPPPAPPPPD